MLTLVIKKFLIRLIATLSGMPSRLREVQSSMLVFLVCSCFRGRYSRSVVFSQEISDGLMSNEDVWWRVVMVRSAIRHYYFIHPHMCAVRFCDTHLLV